MTDAKTSGFGRKALERECLHCFDFRNANLASPP
jgi:hypothetical protein